MQPPSQERKFTKRTTNELLTKMCNKFQALPLFAKYLAEPAGKKRASTDIPEPIRVETDIIGWVCDHTSPQAV